MTDFAVSLNVLLRIEFQMFQTSSTKLILPLFISTTFQLYSFLLFLSYFIILHMASDFQNKGYLKVQTRCLPTVVNKTVLHYTIALLRTSSLQLSILHLQERLPLLTCKMILSPVYHFSDHFLPFVHKSYSLKLLLLIIKKFSIQSLNMI